MPNGTYGGVRGRKTKVGNSILVDVSDVRYLLLSKVIQGVFPFLREG